MFKKYTTLLNLARTSCSLLGLATMFFFYLTTAQAGQVSLAWDASTAPNVGGYRLYYGQASKTYTTNVDVGNKTTYTVTGLQDGATYYFAVKAYDSARTTESGFSNEVSQTLAGAGSPQANFSASPISGAAPLLVTFTDTSTGSITNWSWNFGDGTSPVTSRNALHTYSTPGTYTVSLTVSGSGGSHTATKTNYISATAAPPVANFSASPTTGTAPLTVTFTNTSTGTVTGWSWNFGDGSTSTAKTPAHTYTAAGTYTVRLTATGPAGTNTKTQTGYITVSSGSGSSGSTGGTATLLGNPTIGQMTDSTPQGMAAAFQTQAATTGFMTSLSVYVNGGSTATQLIAGLYSNNNGHPGNLLAQGILNNPVADTWNKVPLPATKINAGSLYWIAILSPNGILQFRDNVGGASQYHETSAQINLTNLPSTWTTGTPSYNGPLSAYGSGSLSSTCPCSIWAAGAIPTVVAYPDTAAVEIGVKFKSDVNGFITGLRFYKASTNTGTHIGTLWSSGGQPLARATFTNETASGWQWVNFAKPVAITANTVYVASYHTNVGRYSADVGYFANAGVDRGPLHALHNGTSGGNGVYLYGPGGFPTETYQSNNYWVDVVFTTQ